MEDRARAEEIISKLDTILKLENSNMEDRDLAENMNNKIDAIIQKLDIKIPPPFSTRGGKGGGNGGENGGRGGGSGANGGNGEGVSEDNGGAARRGQWWGLVMALNEGLGVSDHIF